MQRQFFGGDVIPAGSVFLNTALSYAFVNRKPKVAGHVLVSPVRPVERFSDLTRDEVSDLFLCVHRIAPILQQEYACLALTINLQDGKEAGQTVEHVHVHMLPRKEGDFSENNDIHQKLEDAQPEVEQVGALRSDHDMQLEATHLAKALHTEMNTM